jgi:hypothetical protein
MNKKCKFQDYAEDMDSSQSDDMVPQTLDDSISDTSDLVEATKKMPVVIDATFTGPAFEAICKLNKNLRLERIIFIVAAVIVAAIAAFTFYKGYAVSERSEKMSQWYEENNEAILFGRYLRVNENDRWRYWHDKWVNDPGLKEDMNDYFLMEELKEKKKK